MSLEEAISTGPVNEKLRNLKQYLPDADGTTCLFAEYLAERLGDAVTPKGLRVTAYIALCDLQQNNDRRGGTIPQRYADLTGKNLRYYDLLGDHVPEIASATCPTDFANKVGELYRLAREKVASGQISTIFD